jgi:two-component system chemotaxis sensor kinase CheA
MDVVRNSIRSLHGRIEINTQPGAGSQMTLIIPLSLAFLESLIVRTGDRLYAIPIESIDEVFQPQEIELVRSSASNQTVIMRQGKSITLVSLNEKDDHRSLSRIVVVVQSPLGMMGLKMDEVIGQQQVVMKPLSGHLRKIRGGAGCALLSSGEVAIALNIDSLFQTECLEQSQISECP